MNAEQAAIAALLGMNENQNEPCQSAIAGTEATGQGKRKHAENETMEEMNTSDKDDSPQVEKNGKPVKRRKKNKIHYIAPAFPVQPRVVQVCKMPKTHVDHSYRDFSCVPAEDGYDHPADLNQMSFSQKLHHILSRDDLNDVICWCSHGRAFRILVPKRLEQKKILLEYFGHNRYSTFLSQLKNYGLKQITTGKDKNCFYNEMMLRALPHLTKYMPEFKDGRKLIADPQNEPDLYTISMLWPVPLREKPKKPAVDMQSLMAGLLQQAQNQQQQPRQQQQAANQSISMTLNAVLQAAQPVQPSASPSVASILSQPAAQAQLQQPACPSTNASFVTYLQETLAKQKSAQQQRQQEQQQAQQRQQQQQSQQPQLKETLSALLDSLSRRQPQQEETKCSSNQVFDMLNACIQSQQSSQVQRPQIANAFAQVQQQQQQSQPQQQQQQPQVAPSSYVGGVGLTPALIAALLQPNANQNR